jgi:ATP-binding dynein motor region
VDFTVTQKGLEEQLLGRVIGKEQQALEEQLSEVLEEVNSNTKALLALVSILTATHTTITVTTVCTLCTTGTKHSNLVLLLQLRHMFQHCSSADDVLSVKGCHRKH